MNKTKILLFSVLSMLIIVSSCKKDDPVVIDEFEELIAEVESGVSVALLPNYITAEQLKTNNTVSQTSYIIDIRGAADYNTGHVPNAINVAWGDLLTHLEDNAAAVDAMDDIVIVCYSGQSAAFATALLRLAGYDNAKSLKFGMTSWHSDFDSWTGSVSTYFAQFLETTANTIGSAVDYPVINTEEDNGEDILMARIQAIFDEGFTLNAIAASDVTGSPDNYYVINYWPNTQYITPGHIPGAYCYEPGSSFTTATNLATLPTDETIVVYCYTGQTSAYMAAFLNVLGYDAKTLKFGANSMFTGDLPSSNWSISNIMDYDYDTTPGK